MGKYLKLILCAGAFVFLFNSYVSAQQLFPASDFELPDIQENIISLSAYKGRQPVLLFFWTASCPRCKKGLRMVRERYVAFMGEGLEILSINVGEHPVRVRRYARAYSLVCPVLLDRRGVVAKAYGILGVPTYVLINIKGKIVFQGHYFPQEEYKDFLPK